MQPNECTDNQVCKLIAVTDRAVAWKILVIPKKKKKMKLNLVNNDVKSANES